MEFCITFALWSFSLLSVVVGLTKFFFYLIDGEDNTQEAKPYQFERDNAIKDFDAFSQNLLKHRMYKGNGHN